jgi:dihydroorotate dehydrogenase
MNVGQKALIASPCRQVMEARDELPNKPPVLVKIGPDNTDEELADIASAALSCGVDGAIVSNTTNQRPASLKSGKFLNDISSSFHV